jgi:carbon-monoxide dehydrogenase large subunit
MTTQPLVAPPGQQIGRPVKRREDPRLIQGRATYVDDIKLSGMLHLAFKRSDVAHGTIVRVDTSAAEAMPGVELVMTGADVAAILPPVPIGTPFPAPDHHAVAPETVRYVGEAVALVVATDRYTARDAADAIEVEIERLPAVVDTEQALQGSPAVLHPDFANNVALTLQSGTGVNAETGEVEDDSAIDQAFANAEVTISQRMTNQRLAPNAIEPRGVVAHFEPGKEYLTVWTASQIPHLAKLLLGAALGLGQHQLRVIAPEVGGGFGSKLQVYGEEYVLAAVSRRLGRPVKWIEERSEAFMATTHGRDIIAYIDIAANRDGSLLGMRYRLIQDIGAYDFLLTAAIVPALALPVLTGTYDVPAVRCELTEVFTNKTPTDAYRGAGRPEALYFVERAMDMLARELEMDPAELRRKNFVQPEQFPYTTQMGTVYDTGEYERLLDHALEQAGWEQLKAERDAARAEGRLVGLGLSFYAEICGLAPSAGLPATGGWEHASVTVGRDGTIIGTTGSSSHGQGHETTFAQMLADEFGVPLEDINIAHGDTEVVRQGIGTFGSRSQAVGGTALKVAGGKVRAKMAKFAAQMLEAREADIVFEGGQVAVAGVADSGIPFAEVAAFAYVPIPLPRDTEPGLSEEAFWEPEGLTCPFGCYIAQVEIDRETGELELQKFFGVDDCGNIINPLIVRGQLHGGIAQGVSQALAEEVVYDEDGQLLTGSLLDYSIVRATDFPRFQLDHTVTPTPLNPLGAKGIGEAGTIGSTPCIVSAAVDALAEYEVKHIDMMLRPEKLWRIIHGAGS